MTKLRYMYMTTSVPYVCTVCLLPDVRGCGVASPLTSHVTIGGCTGGRTVISEAKQQVHEQKIAVLYISRYRGDRDWAATAMRMPQCQAINYPSQVNSWGDQDGAAGYDQCQMNFSGVWKHNAALQKQKGCFNPAWLPQLQLNCQGMYLQADKLTTTSLKFQAKR